MSSRTCSSMDFSSFVNELNQSPQIDYENAANRNCYLPETRLSQDFENRMQKLLANYDLDEMDVAAVDDDDPPSESAVCNKLEAMNECNNSGSKIDMSQNGSLDTTAETYFSPVELSPDDFENSDDEGSSDEQQQSRSLSLSYSLSVSHAQENFSQSTDKGLSKRYDSPCSYEDDRESECTNFDKLDDWNDLINDLHNNNNNNNNADNANRDFRDYYEDYLLTGKGQTGTASGGPGEGETNEECDSKSIDKFCKVEDKDVIDSVEKSNDPRPDTPALLPRKTITTEKYRNFQEYRNPADASEREMFLDDNSNSLAADMDETAIIQPSSGKRKFAFEDREDYEYEVNTLIVEKFHKTDVVPDRGCHPPISLIDEEKFAKMTRVEFPNKIPVPELHECDEGKKEADESAPIGGEMEDIATTPTNSRNIQQMFHDEKR
ncbi:probable serine/threonine-protein kinase mps1 [Toxorhynchites rutilus septentrionalis]|uniref:probable serine/threonine-protein kinase mps1 n=1 Tax=Toxorhynchites rutilus septentrionalis TaxID=329112 RepID=UPI00247A7C91|nr:probable serine/threonine-protein kinase mps1 [Toxorhynchites rutilus septentrionalis]